MDSKDNYLQAGLAMNRLNLNSARLVYSERFDEHSIASPSDESFVDGEVVESKRCTMWNFSKHSHDFMELIYFLDGQASIRGDRAEYMVAPFNVIIYPEGIKHQERINLYKHQEVICIGIKFSVIPNLKTILSLKDNDNRLRWIFTEIYNQHCLESKRNGEMVFSLVKLMFLYIQQILEKGSGSSMNRVEQAVCYIRENFNKPINIEELAGFVNISPTFLNKLFKKATGKTPIAYVNLVRMEMAKQLLLSPDATVNIVCEKVGIEDPKYFSRLFKKTEGKTPSDYMKENRQGLPLL